MALIRSRGSPALAGAALVGRAMQPIAHHETVECFDDIGSPRQSPVAIAIAISVAATGGVAAASHSGPMRTSSMSAIRT